MTLGLVALATSLVLPRLTGRGAGSLETTANDVVRRLTTARWRAVVEHRKVTVSLDDLPAALTIATEDPSTPPPASAGTAVLTFAPLPAALPRTIVLGDAAGAHARITVPPGLAAIAVTYEDRS